MSRSMRFALPIVLLALLLAGCNLETVTPTATAILPSPTKPQPSSTPARTATPKPTRTPTPTPSLAPSACNADKVLANLESLIPYEEFELNYSNFSIIGISALNVWYVDPTLDPNATSADIDKNAALALHNAAILSHKLAISDPCIEVLFEDGINPVVVDHNYNGWFAGMIAPSSLPSTQNPGEGELKVVEDAFQIQYLRQNPPGPATPPPDSACMWPEARENIQWHFSTEQPNTSFYLVHDEGGVVVYAQWVVPSDLSDKVAFAFSIASVQNVLYELPCLHPSADVLIATGVDDTGELMFLGRMLRDGIREQDVEQLEVLYPQ